MKTIVEAAHTGVHINGFGGCHTRWANNGRCTGETTAAWLNGLGEDEEPFGKHQLLVNGKIVSNGDVRRNWLSGSEHIKKAAQ